MQLTWEFVEMSQDEAPLDAPESPAAPPVVAFDFDGTLTTRDSFMAFLRWRVSPLRFALGLVRLAPASVAYLVHRDRDGPDRPRTRAPAEPGRART